MRSELNRETVRPHAVGQPAADKRKSKPKSEEVLIDEILAAAGLGPLD